MSSGQSGQFRCVLRCVIGQRIGLEPTPGVLHGVEFGSIGWQPLPMKSTVTQCKGSDLGGTVRLQAIPDQQPVTRICRLNWPRKARTLVASTLAAGCSRQHNRTRHRRGADNQGSDHGDLLVVAGALHQEGCLPAGTPGPAHQRRHQQAAFIQEHQRRVQPSGFFLMRGQSTLTQCWMSGSSRSRARRAGRCGLQPMERSNRPM